MATIRKLTPNAIDNLTRGNLTDPERPGLSIEAGKRGKVWRYYRRIKGTKMVVDLRLGTFPAYTIGNARQWADELNAKVERGEDPRAAKKAKAQAAMTVADAHALYMADIAKGDRKPLRPRTLADKRAIYSCDIAPKLASKTLASVTADDLWTMVEDKGEDAPVRANRMAGEMKVFFGWCLSRPGQKAGVRLTVDPSVSLDGKHFPETKRTRFLSDDEIGWYLAALAQETQFDGSSSYRRGFLLMLLTGCRIMEIAEAPATEYRDGIWHRPADRLKGNEDHAIPLAPWGQSLMATNGEWVIPHWSRDGAINNQTWYQVRDRLMKRMAELAQRPIEHWNPHDLRRTMRSNTRRLKIDTETAEDMMAHKKTGLIETYDQYEALEEKRDGYARWETKLIGIAVKTGVADQLGVPVTKEDDLKDMPQRLAA